MRGARRNKKCLFLSYFQAVVRKKDMTVKPVKKEVFTDGNYVFYYVFKLSSIHVGGFVSGIKMYAYADKHAPERKMIPAAYF